MAEGPGSSAGAEDSAQPGLRASGLWRDPIGEDRTQRQGQPQGGRVARKAAPAEREVEILEKINGCFMVSVMVREWERSSRL